MKTPHKHAALIKAWADGAEIESRPYDTGKWYTGTPGWSNYCEYRLKPEPKPDVTEYRYAVQAGAPAVHLTNLLLTFDGETGKLKAAEVIV